MTGKFPIMSEATLDVLLHEIVLQAEFALRAREEFISAWHVSDDVEMHRHLEAILGHATRISLVFWPTNPKYELRGLFLRLIFRLPTRKEAERLANTLAEPRREFCQLASRALRNAIFHADERLQMFFDEGKHRASPNLSWESAAPRHDGRFHHPASEYIVIDKKTPTVRWLGNEFDFKALFQSISIVKQLIEEIIENNDRYLEIKNALTLENRKQRNNKR